MWNPEWPKQLDTQTGRDIHRYDQYKQKVMSDPGFLRTPYEQKKKKISYAAHKYPIKWLTIQQVIEDLTVASMYDSQWKMTQFGFKNRAEVTKHKIIPLHKQLISALNLINQNPLYISWIDKSNNNIARFGSRVWPTVQQQEIINQGVQLEHHINTLTSVNNYCEQIITRPESADWVIDGYTKWLITWKKIPFVSWLVELNDSINLLTAIQKKQKWEIITEAESLVIIAFTQLEQLNTYFDLWVAYNVGVGTAAAVNFIIELAATWGITSAIRVTASKATTTIIETTAVSALKQSTQKTLVKIAEKKILQTTWGKLLTKVGTKSIEYTSTKLLEKTIIALWLAGIRVDMIAQNTISRMLDHFTPVFDESWNIVNLTKTNSGEPFSLALMKWCLMTFTEFFTEQVGRDLLGVISKVKWAWAQKFVELAKQYGYGIKFLDALGKTNDFIIFFGKRLASSKVANVRSQLTSSIDKKFIEKTLMRDNPFGEYFEEFLSTRVQHYLDNDGILAITTREERETFLVCLMTGAAVKTGGISIGAYQQLVNKSARNNGVQVNGTNDFGLDENVLDNQLGVINLERQTPKPKKTPRNRHEEQLWNGLVLYHNPIWKWNNVARESSWLRQAIKEVWYNIDWKKWSISLKTWKNEQWKLYYYFSAGMSNPINAAKAFIKLMEFVPAGATILEPESLSIDSYRVLLRSVTRGQLVAKFDGYIPLNNQDKETRATNKKNEKDNEDNENNNSSIWNSLSFETQSDAQLIVNKINTMLADNKLWSYQAQSIFVDGLYTIKIPNFSLEKTIIAKSTDPKRDQNTQ